MKHLKLGAVTCILLVTSCGQTPVDLAQPDRLTTAQPSQSAAAGGEVGVLHNQGIESKFIINQLIIKDKKDGKLEKWLKKHNAKIIDYGNIPDAPAGVDKSKLRKVVSDYRLIQLDPNNSKQVTMNAQQFKGLSFKSAAAENTFAAGVNLEAEGLEGGANFLMSPTGVSTEPEGAVFGNYLTPSNFWHLGDFPGSDSTYVFDRGYRGANVSVAIIDTGFRSDDYELSGYDPVRGQYLKYKPAYTYDFENNSYSLPNVRDTATTGATWHGFRAAQTALGTLGNHVAGTGTAPEGLALLFRIPTSYSFWQAGRAVNTAVAWGASVINMSFGGWAGSGYDGGSNFGSALQNAANAGVINIASAGNNGVYSDKERVFGNVFIPAAWNTVIGVGAVDRSGNRSVWSSSQSSNFGPVADIWAAGTDVGHTPTPDETCWSDNQCSQLSNGLLYRRGFDGTSAAAPVVSGIVATMKGANPNLNVYSVKRILQDNAYYHNGMKIINATTSTVQAVLERGGTW